MGKQINPPTPVERLHAELLRIMGEATSYELGVTLAKATGKKPKTMTNLIISWRKGLPLSLGYFAKLLDALGYRVDVVKK